MTDREPVNIMGVIAFPEPDKSKRRIRFIDAEYNTLFYIPDGGSIVMTRLDGGSVIRLCTYIDDYHTLVGSNVYHICEFAEMAQRTGTVYEPLDPIQQPADAGCYEIYQIDNVAKVDYAFMRYENAKGKLRAAHYRKAFAGVLAPNMTLEELYRKHNADTRPFYRQMRSLSESDVIVVKRGSKRNAYYVAAEAPARSPDPPRTIKDRLQVARAEIAAPKQDGVQRLVDIEQKMAEGKGRGYERWAKIHNLKQAAKTLSVYQQYGFTSPEQLEAAVDTAYQKMRQTSGELKALETKLQGKKKLQRQVLAYAQTKAARDGLRAQKSEKARAAYRQAHESDFIIADAAARYFKAHGITKLPARKALQAEIEQLISEKDGLYNTYHEQKQRFKELQTVKRNIDQILRRDEPHRRKEQSHER